MSARYAAVRDASWWDRPNVRSPKKLHVNNGDWMASCDSRIPLDESTASALSNVPLRLRCRRRGCAEHWEVTG